MHVEGKTAASLGYSSLELLGKSYFELVHVDDLEKIEDSFGKCNLLELFLMSEILFGC